MDSSIDETNQGVMTTFLLSPLFRGQIVSILIAGTGVFATLLSDDEPTANFPAFMNFLNYVLLSVYMLRRIVKVENRSLVLKRWRDVSLSNPISLYGFVALLDIEANFLVLTAYNYTSITSIMILDCFTIPCAMMLSSYFLRAKYQRRHIIGIIICLSGLGCIITSDISDEDGMNDAVVGDLMCLAGAFLYACTNVIQERVVKTQDREEYLGMLGLCGAVMAAIQSLATDLGPMRHTEWTTSIILYIGGFVMCLNLMYVNTSLFLQSGDATFFNLSLLTSDVYAVIFSFILTGELVHWLYFLGFSLVAAGLYIYHSSAKPVSTNLLLAVDGDGISEAMDVTVTSSADFTSSVSYNPLGDHCSGEGGGGGRHGISGDEESHRDDAH